MPMHPTEDREKIELCFQRIFQNPHIEEERTDEKTDLVFKSSERNSLSLIREKLRKQRIRNSARKILLGNMNDKSVDFFLNKQAAFAGRVHFVKDPEQEDFLGPIMVTITAENVKEIIDWLTLDNF